MTCLLHKIKLAKYYVMTGSGCAAIYNYNSFKAKSKVTKIPD